MQSIVLDILNYKHGHFDYIAMNNNDGTIINIVACDNRSDSLALYDIYLYDATFSIETTLYSNIDRDHVKSFILDPLTPQYYYIQAEFQDGKDILTIHGRS